MSTSLTPLRRRRPLFGRSATTALAVDEHAAILGADVAPPPQQSPATISPADVERARRQGFDSGQRVGAVRRCWWDVFVGFVWTACLLAIAALSAGAAGYLSITFFPTADAGLASEPPPARAIDTWADRA